MKRTHTYLKTELYEKVRKLAFKLRTTMVSIVNQAVEEFLERQKKV